MLIVFSAPMGNNDQPDWDEVRTENVHEWLEDAVLSAANEVVIHTSEEDLNGLGAPFYAQFFLSGLEGKMTKAVYLLAPNGLVYGVLRINPDDILFNFFTRR